MEATQYTTQQLDRILGNTYTPPESNQRRMLNVDSTNLYYWLVDKHAEILHATLRAAGNANIGKPNCYAIASSILGHEVSNSVPREMSLTVNRRSY